MSAKKRKSSSSNSPQVYFVEFVRWVKEHSQEKDDFALAVQEWEYTNEEVSNACLCVCTHPIQTGYKVQNKHTGEQALWGSECIKKVLPNATKQIKRNKAEKAGKVLCSVCERVFKPTKSRQTAHSSCEQKQLIADAKVRNGQLFAQLQDKFKHFTSAEELREGVVVSWEINFLEAVLFDRQCLLDSQVETAKRFVSESKWQDGDKELCEKLIDQDNPKLLSYVKECLSENKAANLSLQERNIFVGLYCQLSSLTDKQRQLLHNKAKGK